MELGQWEDLTGEKQLAGVQRAVRSEVKFGEVLEDAPGHSAKCFIFIILFNLTLTPTLLYRCSYFFATS